MEETKKKTQERKVVHLQLGDNHYYFGSIEQLFKKFDKDQLGICRSTVKSTLKKEGTIKTDKCIIRQGVLQQSTHKDKE